MSRPKVLQLDITNDEDRAMKDPALVAMVDAGWTVPYIWNKTVKDEGQPVQHYLMVFLMPPGQDHKALAALLAQQEALYRAQEETLEAERLALATTLTAHDTRAHDMAQQLVTLMTAHEGRVDRGDETALQLNESLGRLPVRMFLVLVGWTVSFSIVAAIVWKTWTLG